MFRAAVTITAAVATMLVLKDGQVLQQAGLVSSCSVVASYDGKPGFWQACRPGRLEGRPDLSRMSCASAGLRANVEYWRCQAQIGSGASAAKTRK